MKRRYIEHSGVLPFDASSLSSVIDSLQASLEDGLIRMRRHTEVHSSRRHASVYTGSTGVKIMEHHLRPILPEKLLTDNIPKIEDILLDSVDGSHCGFLATSIGPATVTVIRAIRHPHRLDSPLFKKAFLHLHQAVSAAVKAEPASDDGCEVLYGRGGLLYALLLIRQAASKADQSLPLIYQISELISDSTLLKMVNVILQHGRFGASTYHHGSPPLMWSWHRKRYLGAAHGLAGILHILLHCPANILSGQNKSDVVNTILWLASVQDQEGNWPSKAPPNDDRRNELVQWCHGAPGILPLLSTFWKKEGSSLEPAQQELILNALRRGAELTYQRGFLKKGIGLCHGVAGSVYALLAASDVLDSREDTPLFLYRAAHLAQLAIPYREMTSRGDLRLPDRPLSLYEGLAGMCCALAEVIARLKSASSPGSRHRSRGMPGFHDLPDLKGE
ncbi:Lanthionine synthetase C-like protein [Hymenopellis radicata]|nr:Lanthionine synthetase C-like protein [Hymenopellis radicata]